MKTNNRYIIIDDDWISNLVCNHIIRKFDKDAQITIFTEPEKALEFIHDRFVGVVENNITVMFLDINMPTMSGWEFLKAFENLEEKVHKQISIFLLSSSIDQGDIEKADQHPFVQGYCAKPLSLDTLNLINNKS